MRIGLLAPSTADNQVGFQLSETWFGEGMLWKRLIIRELFGQIQGILMDAQPSYMRDQMIDLSHHTCLDDAIQELTRLDYEYDDAITLYADEG